MSVTTAAGLNARQFTEVPRSTEKDIELALDAAHYALWKHTQLITTSRVFSSAELAAQGAERGEPSS